MKQLNFCIKLATVALLLINGAFASAQVTIGSLDKPAATLDVKASAPANVSVPEGVIVPRLTKEQINDNNSAPKMLYNLNQSGSLGLAAGVNYNWDANYDMSNFDDNPQFVNYALQNYRLKDTSPCINAGIEDVTGLGLPDVDADGNARIFDGRIDIGAYEYVAPKTGIEPPAVQQNLMVYPNPSRDGIFQIITNNNEINWTVYDMKGAQISKGNTPSVDLSFCQKGIYVIKAQSGKNIVTGKLVKL